MLDVKTPTEVENILQAAFGHIRTGVERIELLDSLDRILAADVVADEYVPGFNRSTVDGYAVIAADTFGASASIPAMLPCMEGTPIGQKPRALEKGHCQYVPTGGEIPEGADAMVMIEDVEEYGDKMRYVLSPTAPGKFLCFRGDDVSPGKRVLQAGKRLRPHDIGTLAALGVENVEVRSKPVVGVLSTGDELIDIQNTPTNAQVRDVNSYTLAAGVRSSGGIPVRYGIINDDYSFIKAAVIRALRECDILLLSGGSSVGALDYVVRVVNELIHLYDNSELLLHGIAIKPGKPTLMSRVQGKPVFGLPGHPMAAYFTYKIFVSPLIAHMMGNNEGHNTQRAVLSTNIPSNHGREELAPVKLSDNEGRWSADPIMAKSGLISVLSDAGGFVRIPRDQEGLTAQEEVTVYLL